jgi:hypothetical protein
VSVLDITLLEASLGINIFALCVCINDEYCNWEYFHNLLLSSVNGAVIRWQLIQGLSNTIFYRVSVHSDTNDDSYSRQYIYPHRCLSLINIRGRSGGCQPCWPSLRPHAPYIYLSRSLLYRYVRLTGRYYNRVRALYGRGHLKTIYQSRILDCYCWTSCCGDRETLYPKLPNKNILKLVYSVDKGISHSIAHFDFECVSSAWYIYPWTCFRRL